MRKLLILLLVIAIAVGAWSTLRDGGWLDRVTESRVEQALLDNGVPENMAECMSPRMVDELDIDQLRSLEQLAPQEGEERIPQSFDAAMTRLRRVDDEKAIRVLAENGTSCGIEILRQRVGDVFGSQ